MRLTKYTFATLAATLLAAGCQERAPRSFVQPNVIKKSDLDGTWHYIQTITDAPPTQGSHFIGESSDLMKIRFKVQEDQLFALRAYEWLYDSEDKTHVENPAEYEGEPLAGWKIQKQFDIIREYNSTTGEETNKIIESEERAWNDREFIRVDWSDNIVPNAKALFFEFGGDKDIVQSATYYVSDPTSPDAFHMERQTEEQAKDPDAEFAAGEAKFLDVTNKLNITFAYLDLGDGFRVSKCLLDEYGYMANLDDCSSVNVSVKHGFAKISPKHEYQPRNWDGQQMDMFGIWDVGLRRLTYNRQYGVTNSGFSRHSARFNLWKKSYERDAQGNRIANDDPATAKLDPYKRKPYTDRQLRTIPYYATSTIPGKTPDEDTFPTDIFEGGQEVIKQWNEALKGAVKAVTGTMPDQNILVWCHNPVKQGVDDPVCAKDLQPELDSKGNVITGKDGNPVLRARTGDPRRSHIVWVNQYQEAGPLGYGPPLFDPETGETVSGQAYIYGGALDTYAARSRDVTLLLTGKIQPDQYIQGMNVHEWVDSNRKGVFTREGLVSPEKAKAYYGAMDFSSTAGLAPEAKIDLSSPAAFKASWRNRSEKLYATGVFGSSQASLGQTNLNKLRGSTIEAQLITPEVMSAAGLPPNTDWNTLSEGQKAMVSPLRSAALRKAIRDRKAAMNAFGVDFAEFADEGIAQRAAKLANDPLVNDMDPDAILKILRKEIFIGVTLHEVGHNMGLRHNFRGSYDSLNYHPDYWKLRTAGLSATQRYAGWDPTTNKPVGVPYAGGALCTAGPNAGKLRPRYVDCPGGATSVDEVMGGVRENQYSTIMDYGAEFNSDLLGLGHYDKAAMKFAYSGDGYVEVFNSVKTDNDSQRAFISMQISTGWGLNSPLYLYGDKPGLHSVNYTTFPDLFIGGGDGIQDRDDVPLAEVDYTNQSGVRASADGRPMVPYQFCSDEFAGNITCQRFDSGADLYEQSADLISRYQNFYLMNNFKRDRYTFSEMGYLDRIQGRYLDPLRAQMTWFALLRSEWADTEGVDDFFSNEEGWGPFTVAVNEGFNLLGKILAKPQAGTYEKILAAQSSDFPYDVWRQSSSDLIPDPLNPTKPVVGLIDGKFIDTTWDFDTCGYYWASECQTRIGYFYDKVAALFSLAESQAYFTGRDTTTDVRKYAIGYIRPYKNQMQEKFGAILAGDYNSVAPTFDAQNKVVQPEWALNNGAEAAHTNLVDPAMGFSLQIWTATLGLAYFPTTFDNSFIDTTRIFVLGNGEAPVTDQEILTNGTTDPAQTVGAGGTKEWFTFKDTTSGKTYAAHSTKKVADGGAAAASYRNDTGVRMLITAKKLADAATASCGAAAPTCAAQKLASDKFRDNLDQMRSLHHTFGYSPFLQ